MRNFRSTISMALLVLAIIASGCSAAPTTAPNPVSTSTVSTMIIAEGRLEPVHYVELALDTGGVVSEVLHKDGDIVRTGDVIARLNNGQASTLETAQADALKALAAAYQAVRDAQYNLDVFDPPHEFAGMTAGQAVTYSLDKLNKARDAFEPYKWMNDKQLQLTDPEEDGDVVIRNTPKRLKKQLDDAWALYRQAVKWLDLESAMADAQAQVTQAQRDYDNLQDPSLAESAGTRGALANAELRAPFSGTITKLDLKVGQFAASGISAVTIADFSSWVVKTTDLTEVDVVQVHEGETVTLTLDAIPGVELTGHVLSIGKSYSENQGDIVYEVTVQLAGTNAAMHWGMTAQVNFPH